MKYQNRVQYKLFLMGYSINRHPPTVNLEWPNQIICVSTCSCLWLVWLYYSLTNCFKRAMVWVLVSLSLSPPTSVKPLCGRPFLLPLSTLVVVPSLKERSSPSSICLPQDRTKWEAWEKLSTGRTCPIWWTCWPLLWFLPLSSISRWELLYMISENVHTVIDMDHWLVKDR